MESYERTSFDRTCRGIGDGMQAKGTRRNTGSPSGDRSMDPLAARERSARYEVEGWGLNPLRKWPHDARSYPLPYRSTCVSCCSSARRQILYTNLTLAIAFPRTKIEA